MSVNYIVTLIFTEEWIEASFAHGSISEAYDATHLVEFPVHTGAKMTRAEARYRKIELEILSRTLDAVRSQIGETFVRIAAEVLDRERTRQHV